MISLPYRDVTSESIAQGLGRHGIVVISNYLGEDDVEMINRYILKRSLSTTQANIDYKSGAYTRVNRAAPIDGGVIRHYMPHKEFGLLSEIRNDASIVKGISSYFNRRAFPRVDWLQVNLSQKHNGRAERTRDFHVDIWRTDYSGFDVKEPQPGKSQVKLFLYLTRVTQDDGPFCFKLKTQKHLDLLRSIPLEVKGETTGADSVSKEVDELPSFICNGSAGTLILADVTLFHRGLPQKPGRSRSIYSVSYYDFGGELQLGYNDN